MKRWCHLLGLVWVCGSLLAAAPEAGEVRSGVEAGAGGTALWLDNGRLSCEVRVENGRLAGDKLALAGAAKDQSEPLLETDADFTLEIVWTDWRAPGKIDNGDNPVRMGKDFFRFERHEFVPRDDGGTDLVLHLSGRDIPLEVQLTYRLAPGDFFVRRRLEVRDPKATLHYLEAVWPVDGILAGKPEVIKDGGFGQPVALRLESGTGAFAGLEYPAADNRLGRGPDGRVRLGCGQEIGERIGPDGIASDWVVLAVTPDARVKHWFFHYLDRVRVAPLRPYMLYNSWYDLRAPEMAPDPAAVMNEANVLRIVELFQKNMTDKYGLRLDAFVLDDGWDVYRSDWALRTEQFPRGLKPVADALRPAGTTLGLWFGPTGGYSKRAWRLEWMRAHGYEIVGDQLCVAGTHYHDLLKRRTGEFVDRDGVGYFKWDGIQFACSEPGHGHPVGIHSRRAVLAAVADLAANVRGKNPDMFLNITSGTWLSPWWLRFANQIWMGGEDYGYADVPSISRRDAAITYRDAVLQEDFHEYDFWFPVANLMTHGIIKGRLEKLGGEADPLDKFTDDVLLYFARGVSMYEFYISPDLLSEGEWRAIAESARWARDRFPVLRETEMVGGRPLAGEPYGYVHYAGRRGVIAVRNPYVAPARLRLTLTPEQGLDPDATDLVLERVYPTGWISPRLHRAGDSVELALDGYETAVFELYPLADAAGPLLAGVEFEPGTAAAGRQEWTVYPESSEARWLNPPAGAAVSVQGQPAEPDRLALPPVVVPEPVRNARVWAADGGATLSVELEVDPSMVEAEVAVQLRPPKDAPLAQLPELAGHLDYKPATLHREQEPGKWAWYTVPVGPGRHVLVIKLVPAADGKAWQGKASAWVVGRQKRTGVSVAMTGAPPPAKRLLPPRPWPAGERRRSVPVGMADVAVPGK
jgi:hypothetical protein